MEYLIDLMPTSGDMDRTNCGPEFFCMCYTGCFAAAVCMGYTPPPPPPCSCRGGREGCGSGGFSPEFHSLPPVV